MKKTVKSPTQLLREDHKKVKHLFVQFEKTENLKRQKEIFETVAEELKVHTKVEEELFYPAARIATKKDDLLDEAKEEHHIVDILIAEIEGLDLSDKDSQDVFRAKFTVLSENVKHHIEEEEEDLFPAYDKSKGDKKSLAEQMQSLKQSLTQAVEMAA